MQLPTITAITPITVDAQPQVVYNDAFLTQLHFIAFDPKDTWTLSMNTQNYNAATGDLGPDSTSNRTYVNDVAAYAAKFPVFAQCLGTVLVVAGLVEKYEAAQLAAMVANSLPEDDVDRQSKIDAANTAFTAAKTALGA